MSGKVEISTVIIEKPEEVNIILGQSHFIKTVEDLYEAIVGSVPGVKFGLAFCEASAERLVRVDGTDRDMKKLAAENALAIGAGHSFIILLENCFPINVMNVVKNVPEVCGIYCATSNPIEVVIAETNLGRGILGVIDGLTPLGIEGEAEAADRVSFLRAIGYKKE